MPTPEHVYLLDDGNLVFVSDRLLCQVDDRDLMYALEQLWIGDHEANEDDILSFLTSSIDASTLYPICLKFQKNSYLLNRSNIDDLMAKAGYQSTPIALSKS